MWTHQRRGIVIIITTIRMIIAAIITNDIITNHRRRSSTIIAESGVRNRTRTPTALWRHRLKSVKTPKNKHISGIFC